MRSRPRAWTDRRPRRLLLALFWVAGATLLLVLPVQGEEPASSTGIAHWTARQEPLHEYRAFRRMHARSERLDQEAWIEAWTELDAAGVFRYRIVNERGSESVRKRVLLSVLRREQELARGDRDRAELSDANYVFTRSGDVGDDVVYVQMKPRRKDVTLVDGRMAVSRHTGDLLRIEGRLAKNPSFWTSAVHIVRHFARINGVQVPIALEALARVKIAGDSTMKVVYEYESVNGRPVSPAARQQIAARIGVVEGFR